MTTTERKQIKIYCARGHTFPGYSLEDTCPVKVALGDPCGLYGHLTKGDADEEARDFFQEEVKP